MGICSSKTTAHVDETACRKQSEERQELACPPASDSACRVDNAAPNRETTDGFESSPFRPELHAETPASRKSSEQPATREHDLPAAQDENMNPSTSQNSYSNGAPTGAPSTRGRVASVARTSREKVANEGEREASQSNHTLNVRRGVTSLVVLPPSSDRLESVNAVSAGETGSLSMLAAGTGSVGSVSMLPGAIGTPKGVGQVLPTKNKPIAEAMQLLKKRHKERIPTEGLRVEPSIPAEDGCARVETLDMNVSSAPASQLEDRFAQGAKPAVASKLALLKAHQQKSKASKQKSQGGDSRGETPASLSQFAVEGEQLEAEVIRPAIEHIEKRGGWDPEIRPLSPLSPTYISSKIKKLNYKEEQRLRQRKAEVDMLLRFDLTTDAAIRYAHSVVKQLLWFLTEIKTCAAAMQTDPQDVYQHLLQRVAKERQLGGPDASFYCNSNDNTGWDQMLRMAAALTNVYEEETENVIKALLSGAKELRQVIRIKVQDNNDLRTAEIALKDALQFFELHEKLQNQADENKADENTNMHIF